LVQHLLNKNISINSKCIFSSAFKFTAYPEHTLNMKSLEKKNCKKAMSRTWCYG